MPKKAADPDRTVKTIHEKTGFENRNTGSMGDFDLRSMMTNDLADSTESVIAARIQFAPLDQRGDRQDHGARRAQQTRQIKPASVIAGLTIDLERQPYAYETDRHVDEQNAAPVEH